MSSTEVLEQPPKIHNKTCVLRVSIHCEGCKRKVKRLLQSLPGVEDIEIERQQQRVIVTGSVLPETLLNKLLKAGKHAQFWPENPPEIHARKIEKPPSTTQGSVSEESGVSGKETKSAGNKQETPVEDKSKSANVSVAGGGDPVSGGGGKVDDGGKKTVEVGVKVEEKKPETGPTGGQTSTPVVENKEQALNNGGGSGGSEQKIKKKKKPQISTNNGNGNGNGNHSGGPHDIPRSNGSPTHHQGYDYPPRHHYMPPPPAPVYTMSYNTAHPPANSYTASYYAPPPPQSYAYSHMEMPTPHAASGYESYAQQQPRYESYMQQQPRYESYAQQQPPVDSFEMFSDENPNGCLVM